MTIDALRRALGRRERLALAVAAAPERAVLIGVALALAAGTTVSLGQFRPWTALPLAALIVAALWRPLRPRVRQGDAVGGALAMAGAAVWTVGNAVLSSEYLIVVRDPGFLTLSGLWLVDHPSTDIPARGAIEAADVAPNSLPDAWQAWNLYGDVVQPQGAKMLPATIAIGGWIGGERGVLVANVVIGALGLLAVYALARRMMGPLTALAPMTALGLSVAHVALSRSAYSEPLTLLLVIAGVLWAWRGIAERRASAVVVGALATGATQLIRIDGAAFAAGAAVGVVVALGLSDAPRAWRVWTALGALAAQAAAVGAGYASLWRWSWSYIDRLGDQAHTLGYGYAALVAALALWVATWAPPLRADRLVRAPAAALARRGSAIVGGAVTALLLVLASRPLWTTVRRGTETPEDQFTNSVVESFQNAQGLPLDPTRTYAENTVAWVSYYLTWPVVLLAFLGLGIAAARLARGRGVWAVLLGATLAPSLLYFWAPEIVPDQIWAIRRFEPMTLPAFAIAAMVGALALVALLPEHRRRLATRWAIGVVALAPVLTWVSVMPSGSPPISGATPLVVREMGGAREQLHDLCAVVDGRPVVLAGTSSHFGSLRVMCDVPVVLALVDPTDTQLIEMADAFGAAPVVLTRDPDGFTWATEPAVAVSSTVRQAGYQLGGIPRTYIERDYAWYAGLVQDDGALAPVTVAD